CRHRQTRRRLHPCPLPGRIALDEDPLAVAGQSKVERPEDEAEVLQIGTHRPFHGGWCDQRGVGVSAVVRTPVEETRVDPYGEDLLADHRRPDVGNLVYSLLEEVHSAGYGVVDLVGGHLGDGDRLGLAVDEVERDGDWLEDDRAMRADEGPCVTGN